MWLNRIKKGEIRGIFLKIEHKYSVFFLLYFPVNYLRPPLFILCPLGELDLQVGNQCFKSYMISLGYHNMCHWYWMTLRSQSKYCMPWILCFVFFCNFLLSDCFITNLRPFLTNHLINSCIYSVSAERDHHLWYLMMLRSSRIYPGSLQTQQPSISQDFVLQ